MKFSIIIPIYGVEAYLPACVESVLNQTFSDYEVILVDDGSPDGCGAICDAYVKKDPRFRVIHKENGGLSSARNAGLEIARGEYVYFLDSDDTIDPKLLETVAPIMASGADQVIFQSVRVKDDGSSFVGRRNICGSFLLDTPQKVFSYLRNTLIPCKVTWSACTSVFSLQNIRKYRQTFRDNREIFAEDMQFSLCYACHAKRIESIDCCFYHYRIRESSIMDVQKTRSNLGRIHILARTVLEWYRQFDDCRLLSEQFGDLYYHLIAGQFLYGLWSSGLKPSQYRELVRQEMKDWDAMEQALRSYLKAHRADRSLEEAELRTHVRFLLGGPELLLRLRCRLLRARKEDRHHG